MAFRARRLRSAPRSLGIVRTVLVTGGNRGIGFAMADQLLASGDRVVITSRDAERGRRAREELTRAHRGAGVAVRTCDLSSPDSIRSCAARLTAEGVQLDAIVNNAGVLQAPPARELTAEGVEVTLATNALGPWLLTSLIAPLLSANARVVSLTSRLHLPGSRGEQVDFDFADPNLDHGYHPDRAYKNSKLALIWVSTALDAALPTGVTSNTVCPGFAPVTAARHTRGWMRFKLRFIVPRLPFAVSVEQAAADVLWALDAPQLAGRGGLYLADRTVAEASPQAADPQLARDFVELARRLWPEPGDPS